MRGVPLCMCRGGRGMQGRPKLSLVAHKGGARVNVTVHVVAGV